MLHYIRNRRAQGTIEYVVILAIVVGFAMLLMKTQLGTVLAQKVQDIMKNINGAG